MKIVPSRGDILKENIKKKKQYDRKMALLKFLKGLGISVLSLAIVFTCGIFVVNKIQTRREIFNLSKNGFYHIINLSSNQEINAVLHGNENSPYTIVPIHDIGEDDFNIFMDNILSPFDKTIQYRGCSVMVAHDIWDVVERFESDIFYHLYNTSLCKLNKTFHFLLLCRRSLRCGEAGSCPCRIIPLRGLDRNRNNAGQNGSRWLEDL